MRPLGFLDRGALSRLLNFVIAKSVDSRQTSVSIDLESVGKSCMGPVKSASPLPLKRQTLTEGVVQRLRHEILAGVHPQGAALAEPVIAAAMGVSRAPVREALLELERHGLVEFDDRGRKRVCQLTVDDFEDIYTLRLSLEPAAAGHAAKSDLAEFLPLLKANVEQTEVAVELAEVSRLDIEFHDLIMRASGRQRLTLVWQSFRPLLELWLETLHRRHETLTGQVREITVAAHQEIIQSLEQGHSPAVRKLMQQHIEGWYDLLPSMESQP